MIELPSKSELLVMPTLYTFTDLVHVVTKFFNNYLGHLNIKDNSLDLFSIQIKVVKASKTLTVSQQDSNSYGYYKIWEWGILYYNNVPNLLLINNEANIGPLVYLLGDVNITKTIFYLISQEMEIVKNGFAYDSFDSILNYQGQLDDMLVLS